MKTALIGFTGFVGGNIANQASFDDMYNSQNIADIEGKEYDLVVSAANRAEMWRINQEGEKDLAEIDEYIGHISKTKIKKLVLISTVGVYKNPNGANEDTVIETDGLLPYGANRYHLEQFCLENFNTTIVRLPGLFGKGLKKNVIFDLLHDNNVDRIHKDGVYQYYNLDNIWKDIQVALDNNLQIVNLATPPVSTEEVAKYAFGIEFTNEPADVKPAYWDMHSKHAGVYKGEGDYLYSKDQVLEDIRKFVEQEKESL
ncbi:MAG: pyridine nucleotide transhydrogenase [Candidatus Saccharibacteria bacterium]|nr:MAG: pyridine nucleotide transhydrogenase [Candidatus Saccharibacteria bacterium]